LIAGPLKYFEIDKKQIYEYQQLTTLYKTLTAVILFKILYL